MSFLFVTVQGACLCLSTVTSFFSPLFTFLVRITLRGDLTTQLERSLLLYKSCTGYILGYRAEMLLGTV